MSDVDIRTAGRQRTNSEGLVIVGEHPDCESDGDVVTLWDCDCPECVGSRRA